MSRWIGGDGARPTLDLIMQGSAYGFSGGGLSGLNDTFQNTGVAFGDASSKRVLAIAFCIGGQYSVDLDPGVLDSVTIGGVSASINAKMFSGTTNYVQTGIAYASVPTGTSGTVSWSCHTGLNSQTHYFASVYRIDRLRSGFRVVSASGLSTNSAGQSGVDITVHSNSALIAALCSRSITRIEPWDGADPDGAITGDSFGNLGVFFTGFVNAPATACMAHRVITGAGTYAVDRQNTTGVSAFGVAAFSN